MRHTIIALALALCSTWVCAQEGAGIPMRGAPVNLEDLASLQRGARLFTNYCLSCHSLKYMRFKRVADDLRLTDEEMEKNLMFTTDRIWDTMTVAMDPADAKRWFGAAPPDLSVETRARGADWVYNYLLTFYRDEDPTRPAGVNNVVFKGSAMPDVLWRLQGIQVPVYKEVEGPEGQKHQVIEKLKLEKPGKLSPAEYRRAAANITAFLVYVGEPAKMVRYDIGPWVLLFLGILFVLSYALYKQYWSDIH